MDKFTLRAILTAALFGVGLNFLLNLFTLAIGLNINAYKTADIVGFSYGGFLGFFIMSAIAMFSTGWVAGFLTLKRKNRQWLGALYGFVAWSLLLIFTTIILTNMIQFASFHTTFTSDPNMVAVRITNEKPMIAETKDTAVKIKVPAFADVSKKEITLNAFITFLLFLTGAIFSCIGGYIGNRFSFRQYEKIDQ